MLHNVFLICLLNCLLQGTKVPRSLISPGRLKVKHVVLVWQIDLIESESRVANLRLQRHLCVIEEPVLGVERHVVEALHEGYIDADVELWLELRAQLD